MQYSFVRASLAFGVAAMFCVFAACTTDSGYDPSAKYEGKRIDFQARDVPLCDEKMEGKVFFDQTYNAVAVCAEGEWVVMRKFQASNDPDIKDLNLDRVPYYDEDEDYYDSRNNEDNDDNWYDDDAWDDCIYNPEYCDDYYYVYYKKSPNAKKE